MRIILSLEMKNICMILSCTLILCFIFLVGESEICSGEGDIDPVWTYTTGDDVTTTAISADGNYCACGGKDNNIYFFDVGSSEPLWSYTADDDIKSMAISDNGEYLTVGGQEEDRRVYLFNKDSSEPLWSYRTAKDDAGTDGVLSLDISNDGEYIAAGSANNNIYLFSNDNSDPLWIFDTANTVWSISISSNGEYIAAGSGNGKVYLFDKDSDTPEWTYNAGDIVSSISISSDGEYIAAGTNSNKVHLFHRSDSDPIWTYTADGRIRGISISSDGEYIAAGSYDHNIYVFDKDSSTPLWQYETGDRIFRITISSDGNYIFSGSDDDTIYYFKRSSSTPIWTYETGDNAMPVALTGDGGFAFAGSYDNSAYLFCVGSPPQASIDSISNDYNIEGDTVHFVGSGEDDDGTIEEYRWSSNIDDILSSESSFDTSFLSIGTHTISFSVRDNDNYWSFKAKATVIVNDIPIAMIDINTPTTAIQGEDVPFQGSGIDEDHIIRYIWSSDGDYEFYNGSSSIIQYSSLTLGEHMISLQVQDSFLEYSEVVTTTLIVHKKPKSTIDNIEPGTQVTGEDVLFTGTAIDDNPIIHYVWTSDNDGELYNGTESFFSTNTLTQNTHVITFRVQDSNYCWSDGDIGSLIIHQKPLSTIFSIEPENQVLGEDVLFTGTAIDDNPIIRYVWTSDIDGELYNGTESFFSTNTLTQNTHNFTFIVQDSNHCWSDGDTDFLIIHLKPVAVVDQIYPDVILFGNTVTFKGHGIDDGSIVRYRWTSSLDDDIYNDTLISFSTGILSPGTHSITFQVQDNFGAWSSEIVSSVVIHTQPSASIISISPAESREGKATTFIGGGTDDGEIRKYIWSSSIDGEIYNGSQSEFRRSNLSVGDHIITLIVIDDHDVQSKKVTGHVSVKKEDDTSFLMETIGPLPVYAYIGLVFIGIFAVVGVFMMRKQEIDGSHGSTPNQVPPSAPHQTAQMKTPQIQYQPSPQQPNITASQGQQSMQYQQTFYGPPLQQQQSHPDIAPIQSHYPQPPATQQPRSMQPQQYTQQPPLTQTQYSQPIPPQQQQNQFPSGNQWQCPGCGNIIGSEFQFCMRCGHRKN